MTTAAIEPTRIAAAQTAEAGEVLARAFHTNPIMEYIFPDAARRRRALPWFMGLGARYGHRWGEVHVTPGAIGGAAVWLPPGETIMTPLRMVQGGLLAAPFRIGMSAVMRFLAVTNATESLHKQDVPAQHWYLFILGVDPPRQRQGLGSALLQPVLRRADASRLPCYLETDKPDDVIFYEKHGFAVVRELMLPKGGPTMWTMVRQPR